MLFRTVQGEVRVEIRTLDPGYLYRTFQKTDWSRKLDDWSVFGTKGVALVPGLAPGPALSVQRVDAGFPAAAVWNFPMGRVGTLRLKMMVKSGCKGLNIGLTDHFSPPFDAEESFCNLFNLRVDSNGQLSCGGSIAFDKWQMVRLDWNGEKGTCAVVVDGKRAGSLRIQRPAQGACYLRLTATSDDPEPAGFLVASAEVDVSRSHAGH